jgi:hypothetical protein
MNVSANARDVPQGRQFVIETGLGTGETSWR